MSRTYRRHMPGLQRKDRRKAALKTTKQQRPSQRRALRKEHMR